MSQQTQEVRGEVSMEELRKDYAQIRGVYAAAIQEIDARLKTLDSEFSFRHRHNPIHHIESRVKTLPSIIKKLHSLDIPVSIINAKILRACASYAAMWTTFTASPTSCFRRTTSC